MSGHSKWSTIKHKKGITDAKRGKVFTKHAKMITITARDGGGNPDMNFQLRLAVDRARLDNMPKENIDRAIKKGTGELNDGTEITEITYEGIGPGNVMMLVKTATDNRNRTVSEVKSVFTKTGGKLGEMGSAMWNFKKVGQIILTVTEKDLDTTEEKAIDAGAEDVLHEDGSLIVYTLPENLKSVQDNLLQAGLKIEDASFSYVPLQKATISEEEQEAYEKLLEALDDQDDVQEIFDNL
ncbi:MAG: YebC/PmpR family DNA-binding transcriptional regulator [Parcubacteria group bacterium]|jgi:YebC/PmpR family DNA-binding regulatory protein